MTQAPASPPPPGPPYGGPYVQPEPPKTISVLALVFGGVALLFAVIPFAGILLAGLFGPAAIVLGIVGMLKSHRLMAVIGVALAALGLVVATLVTVLVGRAVERAVDDRPIGFEELTDEEEDFFDRDDDEDEDSFDWGEEDDDDTGEEGTDPDSPFPAGTVVDTGDWSVVLSEAVPDATDIVLRENMFNDPPPDGYQYYMFRVDATFEGTRSGDASVDLLFGVYTDRTWYDDCEAVLPNDLLFAPSVSAGGTVDGNVCIVVPTDGIEDALIIVEERWALGTRYFVEPG